MNHNHRCRPQAARPLEVEDLALRSRGLAALVRPGLHPYSFRLFLEQEALDIAEGLEGALQILGVPEARDDAMRDVLRSQVVRPPRVVAEANHLLRADVRQLDEGVDGAILLDIIAVVTVDVARLLVPAPFLGTGERQQRVELGGVGVKLEGEVQGLPHGLGRLALVAHHVAGVHGEARFLCVRDVLSHLLDLGPLADVVEHLLAAALDAGDDELASRLLHHRHGLVVEVDARVAQPAEPLVEAPRDHLLAELDGPLLVDGEGVVLDDDLLDVGEVVADVLDLLDDVEDGAYAVPVAVHGLWVHAEGAARRTAPAREDLDLGVRRRGEEVVAIVEVALDELAGEGDVVQVGYVGVVLV